MKRKTTPPPKPRGQVTLGQSPPPHQAGHRAIAALLHHPLVLKHSHSRSWCLSGWHPKTGETLTPSVLFPKSYRKFTQTEPFFFQHPMPIHHMDDSLIAMFVWALFHYLGPSGHSNLLEKFLFMFFLCPHYSLKINVCRTDAPNYFVDV